MQWNRLLPLHKLVMHNTVLCWKRLTSVLAFWVKIIPLSSNRYHFLATGYWHCCPLLDLNLADITHISISRVQLFATPWTVAPQASLSMGIPRQESWSGLPFPTPGDLPDLGIEPTSLEAPALTGEFFTTRATWETQLSQVSFLIILYPPLVRSLACTMHYSAFPSWAGLLPFCKQIPRCWLCCQLLLMWKQETLIKMLHDPSVSVFGI